MPPSTGTVSTPQPRPSERVRDFIINRINSGEWSPGEFLPSELALSKTLGVHRLTVNTVIKELVRDGLVERRRGVGTVVSTRTEGDVRPAIQSPMIGLIAHHPIDVETNPFYSAIAWGIRRALQREGHLLLPLGSVQEVLSTQGNGAGQVLAGLAGFIFLGPVEKSIASQICVHGQPAVYVGYSEADESQISISSDDEADSILLVKKLIELGHTKIVHINGAGSLKMHCRLQGYLKAMEAANLPVLYRYVVEAGALEYEAGFAAMREFAGARLPFTAVYGGNDVLALGAMDYLHSVGIAVPRQVSVVGFDGISLKGHQRPRLTTMQVDRARMAGDASRALLQVLNGRTPASERIPSKFIPGHTLAAAPEAGAAAVAL